MLTLDDDETDLVLMALRVGEDACAVSPGQMSAYLLPRLHTLIVRIQQHKQDEAEEKADG